MKQRNIPWLGVVVESAFNTLPVLSAVNFISIVSVLYTSISDYLVAWVPWISFWSFIVIMCGIALCLMALVYIFVLPSLWGFRGQQMFEYKDKAATATKESDKAKFAEFIAMCNELGVEVYFKEKVKK